VEILVDDQPYEPSGPSDQTVAELAKEICATTDKCGERMVVGLRCDGEPIADDDLEAVLRSPSDRFGRLELQTQPVAALVRATLDQAIETFEGSAAARHHAAEKLAEGRHDQAMQELQKFCDVWKQVQQTLVVCAQALGTDLERVRVNDLGVVEILDLIKTQLGELKDAMEKGDLVVVGDILRYEFDEPFANWIALLRHLRETATGGE